MAAAVEAPVDGVAAALRRFGFLDRLVVVRTGSDFEDQRPTGSPLTGRTPVGLYELLHTDAGFAGFTIAVENQWRVGTVVAKAWAALEPNRVPPSVKARSPPAPPPQPRYEGLLQRDSSRFV